MRNVKSASSKVGDWCFVLLCVVISAVCLLPMIHLLAKSLSGTDYLVRHEVSLWPKGFNFDAYLTVLKDPKYIRSFFWTVFLTVVCTLLSLTMTVLCAYPLIFRQLRGRGAINIFITITMFFNAGTIPNYLLMQNLNLLDNPLVLIIPSCLSVYNMIIMRTYFQSIPGELMEAARIDGANEWQTLWRIVLPLSKASIATIGLFYAVAHWNSWFNASIYLSSADKAPLQLVLRNMIFNAQALVRSGEADNIGTTTINYATLFISMVPMMIIYPFVQKYFVKGVMVGSVKG